MARRAGRREREQRIRTDAAPQGKLATDAEQPDPIVSMSAPAAPAAGAENHRTRGTPELRNASHLQHAYKQPAKDAWGGRRVRRPSLSKKNPGEGG
jgi:hypothetical protein